MTNDQGAFRHLGFVIHSTFVPWTFVILLWWASRTRPTLRSNHFLQHTNPFAERPFGDERSEQHCQQRPLVP
jgi:hypothetical protein